jgi:BlaI family transcriptional regulator, penicillinase repressor
MGRVKVGRVKVAPYYISSYPWFAFDGDPTIMTKRGELERQVMDALWDHGEATVRDMVGRLGGRLAYTTVMTVLDRLHTKGEVVRHKEGLAWLYQASAPREKVIGDKAAGLLTGGKAEAELMLMAFIDRAEQVDPSVLDKLEQMIQKRRKCRRGD